MCRKHYTRRDLNKREVRSLLKHHVKRYLKKWLRRPYYRFKHRKAKSRNRKKLHMSDSVNPIRWGIIGTGNIANSFANGLSFIADGVLMGVGSRRQESAESFGKQFGVPKRYGSYEALVNDPEIDAIYISTPHTYHMENTLLCLEAGKAVLCEKPFAINTQQSEIMIQKARQKNIFLMEAMWTRFIPATIKVRELIADDVIGDVRFVQADFGFRADFDPKSRLFDPELGGGTLLDIGIYPVSFAIMLLGLPDHVSSEAHLGKTGIDEQNGITFRYNGGQLAVLSSTLQANTPWEALIVGTKGKIKMHRPFWCCERLTLSVEGKDDEVIDIPVDGSGYRYEATEVMNCIRTGKTESDIMPLDETLAIMKALDNLRADWGLKYPME